jgi:hypothetical protein
LVLRRAKRGSCQYQGLRGVLEGCAGQLERAHVCCVTASVALVLRIPALEAVIRPSPGAKCHRFVGRAME